MVCRGIWVPILFLAVHTMAATRRGTSVKNLFVGLVNKSIVRLLK